MTAWCRDAASAMKAIAYAAVILLAPWLPMVLLLSVFGTASWPCFFAGAYAGWLPTFVVYRERLRRLTPPSSPPPSPAAS